MNRDWIILILSLLLIAFIGIRGFIRQKRRIESENACNGGCNSCCGCKNASCAQRAEDGDKK